MKVLPLLLLLALHCQVGLCALKTNKWDKQRATNAEFCGSQSYLVKTSTKYCQSFWLSPVRYDKAIIEAGQACAVCSTAGFAGCVSCGASAVKKWFIEMAAKQGQALAMMGSSVQANAGNWLMSKWTSILAGRHYSTVINGWKVSARGGMKNFCSQECTKVFWKNVCGPRTCLQDQPYIQIKVEKSGYSPSPTGGSASRTECHKVTNNCYKTAWAMFGYKDTATGKWVARGWNKFSGGGYSRNICYKRGSHLYLYWNYAGTPNSRNSDARFSIGTDATFCGCTSKQMVYENYRGYNYYDGYSGKGSSYCSGLGLTSCGLKTFEHIDNGRYGSSTISCTSGRLLRDSSDGSGQLIIGEAVNKTALTGDELADAIDFEEDNDELFEVPELQGEELLMKN